MIYRNAPHARQGITTEFHEGGVATFQNDRNAPHARQGITTWRTTCSGYSQPSGSIEMHLMPVRALLLIDGMGGEPRSPWRIEMHLMPVRALLRETAITSAL